MRKPSPANLETSKWFNLPFYLLLTGNCSQLMLQFIIQSRSQLTLSIVSPRAYARLGSAEALGNTGRAALKGSRGWSEVPALHCCPADSPLENQSQPWIEFLASRRVSHRRLGTTAQHTATAHVGSGIGVMLYKPQRDRPRPETNHPCGLATVRRV